MIGARETKIGRVKLFSQDSFLLFFYEIHIRIRITSIHYYTAVAAARALSLSLLALPWLCASDHNIAKKDLDKLSGAQLASAPRAQRDVPRRCVVPLIVRSPNDDSSVFTSNSCSRSPPLKNIHARTHNHNNKKSNKHHSFYQNKPPPTRHPSPPSLSQK